MLLLKTLQRLTATLGMRSNFLTTASKVPCSLVLAYLPNRPLLTLTTLFSFLLFESVGLIPSWGPFLAVCLAPALSPRKLLPASQVSLECSLLREDSVLLHQPLPWNTRLHLPPTTLSSFTIFIAVPGNKLTCLWWFDCSLPLSPEPELQWKDRILWCWHTARCFMSHTCSSPLSR